MDKKAHREILDEILKRDIKSKKEVTAIKREICKKYSLANFPRHSDILELATEEEREKVLPYLRKKPSRTISGVAVVAVMSKPIACPHGKCTMCPGGPEQDSPQSYTGYEPAAMRGRRYNYDPQKQVEARIKQLEAIGHNTSKIELILMGGTLPAAPKDYQQYFIKGCLDGITNKNTRTIQEAIIEAEASKRRCVGITIETRPDNCTIKNMKQQLDWGITRVEIGVQALSDKVYKRINRGHTVQDVTSAFRILRDVGLKVTAHVMIGLPGMTWEEELQSFITLMNDERFIPDELKIYPLMLMENTKLFQEYQEGNYQPLTTKETIRRVAEYKTHVPPTIRIKRVLRDIPAPRVFAGPKKSDLRTDAQNYLKKTDRSCRCIRCREVGHRQREGIFPEEENITLIRRDYKASNGLESFLSFEDPKRDIILGFLRLRKPSQEKLITATSVKSFSIIRELHVYGSVVGLNSSDGSNRMKWQHRGFGTQLLEEATRIALEEHESKLLLVTSGIGVREYYKKKGFEKLLPYMVKKL